jgi:molecular chaperone DnaJ
LSTTASINFIDSVNGTTVKLNLRNESVSVKVPAGIQDGQKLKVKGKGQPSPNGGPAGDLVVTIKVKPHAVFTRDGDNIRVSVPVTYAEATLGATIEVPVLGGDPVKLKVAAGTPNGRTLRVKGKGVQFGSRQGDLLATVEVMVPGHLPAKAKKLLEQFDAELPDENPRQDLISRAGTL